MTWINSNTSPSATILTIADFNDLEVFSNSHRTTYNMVDEENLFVGVAWVTASDFCLVNGKPCIHLANIRPFLPKKSAAAFRWLFFCHCS
jgi:hypothetical protein